jgi:SAM-dependent methyltransferase
VGTHDEGNVLDRLERIEDALHHLHHELLAHLVDLRLHLRDLMLANEMPVTLRTSHPVALASDDHRSPMGVANDNTHCLRFVKRIEDLFQRPVSILDLGCAGGGLVLDFLRRGHFAIGLEGSDFALRNQRGEWAFIPDHLFTCDVTQEFELRHGNQFCEFDLITAWELLEHIPRASLPGLFSNIRKHLAHDGLFTASVATFDHGDPASGARWHVTVKPRQWWLEIARAAGFEEAPVHLDARDFPRVAGHKIIQGSLGGTRSDWDAAANPAKGFHLILRQREATG